MEGRVNSVHEVESIAGGEEWLLGQDRLEEAGVPEQPIQVVEDRIRQVDTDGVMAQNACDEEEVTGS